MFLKVCIFFFFLIKIRSLVIIVEQVNAVFASSHDGIKTVTELIIQRSTWRSISRQAEQKS